MNALPIVGIITLAVFVIIHFIMERQEQDDEHPES